MFVNWIDELTASHILALKGLNYLDQYTPEKIRTHFSEWENKRAIYNQILKPLAGKGLGSPDFEVIKLFN